MFLSVLSVNQDISAIGNIRQVQTGCHNTTLAYKRTRNGIYTYVIYRL